MSAAKKGLGRGLSALFGDIENKSTSVEVQINKVPIANLQRNKYQPRTVFDEEKISELSSSIKENGMIQPIAVRPNKYEPGNYEIVAGERRWLAAQRAGLNEVPVILLNIDDQKSLEIAIDGGIGPENIASLAKLGVDIFVAGSSVFKKPSISSNIHTLREKLS